MVNNDNINAPRPGQVTTPDPARHSRKCVICRHPDREAIEEEFTHWLQPDTILDEYDLPSRSALYRHAHATGLYAQRRRNMRHALENIIEESSGAKVTGDTVIRAIRAHSRVNDEGRWIEPPKHLIISKRPLPLNRHTQPRKSRSAALPPPASELFLPAAPTAAAASTLAAAPELLPAQPAPAPAPEPARKVYTYARNFDDHFIYIAPKQSELPVTNTKQTIGPTPNRDTKTIRNAPK